ncbi:type VI secretion system membrane subunit TssM [Epibacterium sp. SM1979]|uniref:Type VI secretion system membrane subunit TssM n=1 Tax=Tritonibacter litoralis TaxID=2662264 RepID=A0A843YN21_9RHOB|nr:type VI secretion system membrane subunit TssM [Tritonibacter litoralis]MQQ10639.1 type VI secretion system membrane subunit TssM [Tritonibacter litoralis]
MRLFGFSLSRLWQTPWMRVPLIVVGIVSICLAVWFGFLWTGVSWLISPWLRGGVIFAILGVVALAAFLKYRKRKAAAQALEEALIETPVGDGAVLADRMREALGKLKKNGGTTYLYDLPWYIIIGPPGAGKTTALVHSGLEFPGTDKAAVAGFGGTKNCDFWFTEEAVMIDTAGRYTTQDSDERADRMSWQAFLEQLKTARPNQPVNGVILAFSCDDLLTASDDALDTHAVTIRKRLEEIHEKLRIDVPVYVMFTKADMVAGFREFFGPFGEDRRRSVWGVTFQTKNRKEETYKAVPAEFDALVSRLSNEVTDRLNEEPDGVARISIFGFPGQMALLQRNVSDFMRRVFQRPQEIHAILRGFYFTSGTQEGTPIDQVLGAIGGKGFDTGFMSGKGRSFFLHDLLQKVIFAERDWVGYDLKAMRRRALMRMLGTTTIVGLTTTSMGLFGYSYWKNASLIKEADQMSLAYSQEVQADPVLRQTILDDPSPLPVMEALALLRDMPGGWGDPREQGIIEHMGLSRRGSIRRASLEVYSDGLERHLRPRMMLQLENELQDYIGKQETEKTYRALKAYILLAKQQPGKPDEAAIQAYFADAWLPYFSEVGLEDEYSEINDHLAAMLELDDRVEPRLKPNNSIVEAAQLVLATLPLAQQAYSSIQSDAAAMAPYSLSDALDGVRADLVFRTTDGRGLNTLTLPGLYTFSGYWGSFRTAMETAAQRLEEEAWVLGKAGEKVDYSGQMAGLNRDIHALYQADFNRHWQEMLDRIELTPMSQGAPEFPALSVAGVDFASPILKLAEAVDRETRLSRFLDTIENMEVSPQDLASGNVAGQLGDAGFSEVERRSGAFQRIALNLLKDKAKFQGRAAGVGSTGSLQRRQLEDVERNFEKWHKFVDTAGGARGRPVDVLLAGLRALAANRQSAARTPNALLDSRGLQDALNDLTQNLPFYPQPVIGFVNQIESEFLTISANTTLEQIQRALNEEITAYCRQNIETAYPFASGGRHISTAVFGDFFGYGGRMEKFYQEYLRDYTQRDGLGGLVARSDRPLGARLSQSTLSQFARAERIRQAFFPADSNRPSVSFTIRQTTSSEEVDSTLLAFGERRVKILPNSTAVSVTWPEETADIVLTLLPQKNRVSNSLRFGGGRWAITEFIEKGRGRANGTQVDITHSVGGRSGRYRLEFDSITVPFLMKELRAFQCPQSLE